MPSAALNLIFSTQFCLFDVFAVSKAELNFAGSGHGLNIYAQHLPKKIYLKNTATGQKKTFEAKITFSAGQGNI